MQQNPCAWATNATGLSIVTLPNFVRHQWTRQSVTCGHHPIYFITHTPRSAPTLRLHSEQQPLQTQCRSHIEILFSDTSSRWTTVAPKRRMASLSAKWQKSNAAGGRERPTSGCIHREDHRESCRGWNQAPDNRKRDDTKYTRGITLNIRKGCHYKYTWVFTEYVGGLKDYIDWVIQVLGCELKGESLSISPDMSTGGYTKYTRGFTLSIREG